MRGQLIVCKDFSGELLERVVWQDSAALIFIHTADQFDAHLHSRPHLEPVGFPVQDVFMKSPESEGLLPYGCPVTAI
jgi:hypothetical protein